MGLSAKIIKPVSIELIVGEILPPGVVSWLTRRGDMIDMVSQGMVALGRES
jgi:hypothetical protein